MAALRSSRRRRSMSWWSISSPFKMNLNVHLNSGSYRQLRNRTLALIALVALATNSAWAGEAPLRDLAPDTWVAQDALGRNMPTSSVVGTIKKDHRRVVGIFYITWHSDSLHKLKSPYTADVSRVLATDPAARLDAKHPLWTEGSYHWGEPETGYF